MRGRKHIVSMAGQMFFLMTIYLSLLCLCELARINLLLLQCSTPEERTNTGWAARTFAATATDVACASRRIVCGINANINS